ncbi:MAG: hypothetical protein WCY01_10715 [Alkalispirochaeta sp.]
MVELDEFTTQLETLITARGENLQTQVLPALKEQFKSMRASFEALHTTLQKKGLIREDPYHYEERVAELTVPSDAPYLDSEKDKALSERLGQYRARMEFLTEYYDFSLDNLNLRALKEIVKFVKYINWRNLSETATQPTTRGLAEQLIGIKRGSNQLSINIVKDAQEQLNRISATVQKLLKEITTYYRESYKLQIRLHVLERADVQEQPDREQYDAAARKVKSALPKVLPGQPFARDLVLEIFAENDPVDGEGYRQSLLESLSLPKQTDTTDKKGPDLKPLLLDAARSLAASSRSLEEGAQKLEDNSLVLESRKLTFREFLSRLWDHLRGKDEESHVYVVDYLDATTNTRRSDEIVFEDFIASIRRRARIYGGILNKGAQPWRKLQESSEDAILKFVMKDTNELNVVVRRFESLDTYFRSEVSREQWSQLRGTNVEITTIRDHVLRTRKKTQQYVSKTEEIQQLRKLGMEDAY